METAMSHELAAVPLSLLYDDGSMTKTTKADLAKKLESVIEESSCPVLKNHQHISSMAWLFCSVSMIQAFRHSKTWRISSENTVILAGGFENGEEVKRVTKSGADCLTDLYSDQEEADTRLVLHARIYCPNMTHFVTDDNVDE
ncbi:probable ATP-dependent RNA helicase DDX17 [Lates japonicus]|uniref:Probable ATP-dependent RNA helicase DDX17 n=1 Tax=Lates japonicus TaxID=270547 RepID=A0AAD3NNG9_LATJO|nr:probable ATP-dependent RNA helicase DDX17 [Lates japonicus]